MSWSWGAVFPCFAAVMPRFDFPPLPDTRADSSGMPDMKILYSITLNYRGFLFPVTAVVDIII
jgi:hypothetical protein